MTTDLDRVQLATSPEQRALGAARLYVRARQTFNRMRTSKQHSTRDLAAARYRRDMACDLLAAAVEELDA